MLGRGSAAVHLHCGTGGERPGPRGRALIDRRLYLPHTAWFEQPDHLFAASVPDEVGFATKPAPARQMIAAVMDGGVPFGWVIADEVYGVTLYYALDLENGGIDLVLVQSASTCVGPNRGPRVGRCPTPLTIPWMPVIEGPNTCAQQLTIEAIQQ
ncbi:transposase [Micromonospora sp. WMMD967]|uniref:transposase n=1 Tax=Micromonospora sp. WMMD967 TaxID=3016101 RepID=UPI002416D663|nr:transposase [Micromonospora sp. WMMD967]MDG4838286.1 transposase [Micromonospora sp. WMMD967]